ncbi:MAG: hypothetical protein EBR82_31080 [Caulobacteraceae bacterium]|nr:hypothetical protein [Caulobacteraceae bacterium]
MNMQNILEISPDLGVPITPETTLIDLRDRTTAAWETIKYLQEHGGEDELDLTPNAEDQQVASALATAYANNPENTSKEVTTSRAATLSPACIASTRAILDEWGHAVVNHAIEVRHMVTNKLIQEAENPDPRVRIRALELLGKISDVGLFAEKAEITVTHQSTDDLRQKLREKLQKLQGKPIYDTENIVDAIEIQGKVLDLDEELGLSPKK